eukprot:scaffold12832_cov50-Attheya_sp.AAC.5
MAPPDEIQLPLSSREQQATPPTRIKIEEGEEEEDMALVLMDEETIDGSIRQQEDAEENTGTNNMIQLSPRMALKTRFPPGCPVVYDDGEACPVPGHVASVGLQVVMDDDADGCLQSGQCIQLFYTIETIPNNKNKTDNDTEDSLHELVAPEDTLSFAIHCPVFVSLPNQEDADDNDCWLEGSIRMSSTTYLTTLEEEEVPTRVYYVDVTSNDGRKQKVNGLSSENLRFRSNQNNNTIQKKEEKAIPVPVPVPVPVQINKEVSHVRRVSNICNKNQVLDCSGTISSAPSVGTLNSNSNNQDPWSSISTSSTHQNSNHQVPQSSFSTSSPHLPQEKSSARQKREAKAVPVPVQINKQVLPVRRVSNSCDNNQVLAPSSDATTRSAPSVGTNHQDPRTSISTSSINLRQEKSSASSTVRVSLETDRKRKDPPENTDPLESQFQVTPAFTRNGQNNEACVTANEALSGELTKNRCMPSIDILSASQDGTGGGEMSAPTTKLRWSPPREIQQKAAPPIPRKPSVHRKGGHSAVVVTFPHWMCPKQVHANIFGVNNSNQNFLDGLPICNLTFTTGKEKNINRRLRNGHPQIWIDDIDGPPQAVDAVTQIELKVVSKLDHQRQGKLLYELALMKTKASTYYSDQSGHVVQQYDTDLKTHVWMSNVLLEKDDGLIGFVIGGNGTFRKRVVFETNCLVKIYAKGQCSTQPYVFITGSDEWSVHSAVCMIQTRIRVYREGGV